MQLHTTRALVVSAAISSPILINSTVVCSCGPEGCAGERGHRLRGGFRPEMVSGVRFQVIVARDRERSSPSKPRTRQRSRS